ncbi:MAG TPA: phosphatidate cytidylyltransferase [Gemmatimonadales bacterium]|nr:phosphatidate cytidylyltransferase [Gemmatimonadales bacterium]
MPFAMLTAGTRTVLLAIFVLLVVASVASWIMHHRHGGEKYVELRQRVRAWWVMVIIFVVAIALDRRLSIAFFAFVSFLALKEYFSLIPTRRADRRVLFWAYLSIPVQYYWVARGWYGMFIVFIPVWVMLLISARMVTIGETKDFLRAVGTIQWGLMLMVFAISHIAYLLALAPMGEGAALVLFLVLLTQLNDVAQYIWGKSFGKHTILPTVSPNKTVQGLVGGILTTTILSYLLAPVLTPLSRPDSIAVGLIIGMGGFLGDTTIGALKRDLGVKDAGTMIAGHGGVLDRVNSLTYTAPLFLHFLRFYYF